MYAPIDMLTATQDAVIAAIRAALPEDQRGMVKHTIAQDTLPPFHLVGEIDTDNQSNRDEQFEQLTVNIYTVYRGSDRRDLLALMHPVRVALDLTTLTIAGVSFTSRFNGASVTRAGSDGVTFSGITQIDITAEPA